MATRVYRHNTSCRLHGYLNDVRPAEFEAVFYERTTNRPTIDRNSRARVFGRTTAIQVDQTTQLCISTYFTPQGATLLHEAAALQGGKCRVDPARVIWRQHVDDVLLGNPSLHLLRCVVCQSKNNLEHF